MRKIHWCASILSALLLSKTLLAGPSFQQVSPTVLSTSTNTLVQCHIPKIISGNGSKELQELKLLRWSTPAAMLKLTSSGRVVEDMASDSAGNVYFAVANSIYKMDANKMVRHLITIEGATLSYFEKASLVIDQEDNLYLGYGGKIYQINLAQPEVMKVVAGTGEWGQQGDGGPAVQAEIGMGLQLAVDSAGDIYFSQTTADKVTAFRKIDRDSGVIYELTSLSDSDNIIRGVFDSKDQLYFNRYHDHRVFKANINTGTESFWGISSGQNPFSWQFTKTGIEVPLAQAMFSSNNGMELDSQGNLYFFDDLNDALLKIFPEKNIAKTMMAGNIAMVKSDPHVIDGISDNQLKNYGLITIDPKDNLYFINSDDTASPPKRVLVEISCASTWDPAPPRG